MKSSSSCCRSRNSDLNHERFVRTKLGPAIVEAKLCPICLNLIAKPAVIAVCLHAYCTTCIRKWSNEKPKCPLCNAQFASLFVEIDLRSKTYRTQHLSAERDLDNKKYNNNNNSGRRRYFAAQRRAIGIVVAERNAVNGRTRPLPRQRSFAESSMLPAGPRKEMILQWRASIYEQNLRAELCPSRSSLEQCFIGRNGFKERLLQKIEPWIHRELHAVLRDPNPAVLVHLVTSLYISSLEEIRQVPAGPCSVENNYVERLQPFLLERTNTFWHELRCFAESSFNMETYDTVVKYEKWSN